MRAKEKGRKKLIIPVFCTSVFQVKSFELLYVYDEEIGHYMW